MLIQRAYKTELEPNKAQVTLFKKHCGAARFAYNWALADRIKTYEETGKSGNLYEQKKRFNALKHEQYPWLREVAYRVVEQAFANLDRAYQNFFRRLRKGEKPGFPRFKSRKRGLGAFTLRGNIHVEPGRIRLPRIGWVRLKERGYLPTEGVKILSANVSERAGHWFVSLQVEQEIPDPQAGQGAPIGVDLGLKTLAVCSDGTTFENPRALRKAERKIKRLQREVSRRKKGGNNRKKSVRKLARAHYRVACLRQHALHQVSHYLTAEARPSVVVIEDLNVSGMLKNHSVAKSVADASFGEVRRQIEYKGKWYGVEVVSADQWYPSSKTCSECGSVKPLLSLSERTFVCEDCGAIIDRDLNAARNLAALASEGRNAPGLPVELAGSKTPLRSRKSACRKAVSPARSGAQAPGTPT